MTKSERWILSEWLVVKDRIRNHGEILHFHREDTPYAEVDLLLKSRDPQKPLILIEVKTATPLSASSLWGTSILPRRQLQRLEKARWYFELKSKKPVRLVLAIVDPPKLGSSRIRYFEAPFGAD